MYLSDCGMDAMLVGHPPICSVTFDQDAPFRLHTNRDLGFVPGIG